MLQQNWFCSEWPDTNISSHSKLSNFDKNVKPSVFHAHFLKTPLLSQVIMSWAEWSKQFHHNYYHVWLLRYAHSSCLYLANIFHDFKWTYLNNWTWYNRTDNNILLFRIASTSILLSSWWLVIIMVFWENVRGKQKALRFCQNCLILSD